MKLNPETQETVARAFYFDTDDGVYPQGEPPASHDRRPELLLSYLDELRRSHDFDGDEEDVAAISQRVQVVLKSGPIRTKQESFAAPRRRKRLALLSPIMDDAQAKIARFNEVSLHTNIVTAGIYQARARIAQPFSAEYQQYIIAGLVVSDVQMMLGSSKYSLRGGAFGERLFLALWRAGGSIGGMMETTLVDVDLPDDDDPILRAYTMLSDRASDLHAHRDTFHLGATRILHFLNPELFVVVDRNSTAAYSMCAGVNYTDWDEPGYSAKNYVDCMRRAQRDIRSYGAARFRTLEPGTPLTRIYEKLTFITGAEHNFYRYEPEPKERESKKWFGKSFSYNQLVETLGRRQFEEAFPRPLSQEEKEFFIRSSNQMIEERGPEWFKDHARYLIDQLQYVFTLM